MDKKKIQEILRLVISFKKQQGKYLVDYQKIINEDLKNGGDGISARDALLENIRDLVELGFLECKEEQSGAFAVGKTMHGTFEAPLQVRLTATGKEQLKMKNPIMRISKKLTEKGISYTEQIIISVVSGIIIVVILMKLGLQ
ncbi:MAG: hypothetical protein R3A45_08780 [Bdellovibrionota bacterium]